MKQSEFFSSLLPLARKAGEAFRINPAVILAQAAIESGWGQSDLASEHHNYFGLTAYGRSNVWWKGASIELGAHSLRFRTYDSPGDSFMDYARLIRSVYPFAADVSDDPKAFARKIAYSKYISEVNGDNRAAYQALLVKVCRKISKLIPHPINHNSSSSASSPPSPGSSFPGANARLPVTTFVLVLCLSLLSLLSLWKGETEVTLAALGAILSLLSPRPPKPTGSASPATP